MNLFETLKPMTEEAEPTAEEKEQFFVERTARHISAVVNAAKKILDSNIVDEYPQIAELATQVNIHDASKLEEPERTPYVDLTWNYKVGKKADNNREDIQQATLHHITHNSHHPEYHLADQSDANLSDGDRDKSEKIIDASNMPQVDIAEMIADWQAMSDEKGTNTAREWYDDVKNTRWTFSEEQDILIDKLLKVFE